MINVVDHKMAQLHRIDRALDRETARTRIWLLDTGVTEHGASSLGVSRKDGFNNGVERASGGNKRAREHKIVSVSNANSRFCNHCTLDGSTQEGYVIGFDMGIIIYSMREIDGWRC